MGKWIHRLSNIDETSRSADCSNCGRVKIKRKHKNKWACRIAESKWLKSGIGYGYREGNCSICGKFTNKLVLDHNHATGQLREWVCSACNFHIGIVETKYKIIYEYLEKHK